MALYHTVKGPVTFTTQGTPTIVDGIVSNFATDSYLGTSSSFQRSQTSWELQIRATPGTGYAILMGSRSAADWRIQFSASALTVNVGNGNIRKNFDTELNRNTFYNVKVTRNGNEVSIYLDDTLVITNTAEFTGTNNQVIQFGNGFYNWQNQFPYDGKIDTNNTYIKETGAAWLGLCPIEVKKVVRHGEYPAEVSGVDSLSLPNAKANSLTEVKLFGSTEQNGTPTPTQPIDIVCNNGAIKVSKNLFDKTAITEGYIYNAQLEYVTSELGSLSDYISVKAGETYTLSCVASLSSFNQRVNFFNSSKEIQSQVMQSTGIGSFSWTITIPNNISYIRYSFRTEYLDTQQLEQGSSATPYRPYGQIYTDGTQEVVTDSLGNTANAERLLAVGNYKDTQEVLSGAVTRNVGIKVLDGTEDWIVSTSYLSNMYNLEMSDLYTEGSEVASGRKTPYCTHFQRSTDWRSTSDRTGYIQAFTSASNKAVVGLGFSTVSDAYLPTFKAWLAEQYANGTPVIVVYPLATATTESVTSQTLNVQTGNNTLSVTQASMSDLELSAKYAQGERDVNYVVKDSKLVFADSGLYLAGPVNYEVVGSPTIVDGVASDFSTSNYLSLGQTITITPTTKIEIYSRFKTPATNIYEGAIPVFGRETSGNLVIGLYNFPNWKLYWNARGVGDLYSTNPDIFASFNTWYRMKYFTDGNGNITAQVYADNGNLIIEKSNTITNDIVLDNIFIGKQSGESVQAIQSVDLNETYIKVNNQLWFYGKNYATKNIAPVPANYTYGTTTTPSIGYVDMRTQQFTAAPSGATIGRDE